MTERRRHLHLDLESTLIAPVPTGTGGWYHTDLYPAGIARTKEYIRRWQPHSINIFSFAIWNEEERQNFNLGCRPGLEKALGIKFDAVPTVEEMCRVLIPIFRRELSRTELLQFLGKQIAFRECMHARGMKGNIDPGIDVTLLDDVVYNESFNWPEMKISGHILNIDQMEHVHDPDSRPITKSSSPGSLGWDR